jgi:hypothetical protein
MDKTIKNKIINGRNALVMLGVVSLCYQFGCEQHFTKMGLIPLVRDGSGSQTHTKSN